MNHYGQPFLNARKQFQLTQTELAEKLGISVSYVSYIERGHRTPHLKTFELLAAFTGLPLHELLHQAAVKSEVAA